MADTSTQSVRRLTKGLLAYLAKNRQLNLLPELVAEAVRTTQKERDSKTAVVWSVRPLEKPTLTELKKVLSEVFGRTLEASNRVDKTMIGGLIVKVADTVIDLSLRRQLEQLEESIVYSL